MRSLLTGWLLLGLGALGLLAGCQRAVSDEERARSLRAGGQYPWDAPGWAERLTGQTPGAAPPGVSPTAPAEGSVQLPTNKGHHPLFDPQDTLNPQQLPGDWLIAAYIADETDRLVEPANMSMFRFAADGTFSLLTINGGEIKKTSPGTWEKSGPGMLLVAYGGNAPYTFYSQFDGPDFLFLWTFEGQNGLWLVRRPAQSAPHIPANDFDLSDGEHLHIAQSGAESFAGSITGAATLEVNGGYNQGVLNLRWIDHQNNVDGYAALIVSADGRQLHGVWWLSDFTSTPFGGHWETSPAGGTPASPPPGGTPPASPDSNPPGLATPPAVPPAAPPGASPPAGSQI
jgi:hypothetical protein